MPIDAGTRKRLTLGLIASYLSRFATTLIQLVQVPFFLHFWAFPVFGEWMILSSIPTYLSFSNTGFGNVAGNEMMMAEARGDRPAALRAFQSTWWLILATMLLLFTLLAFLLHFLPIARLLNLHNISESDTRWIIAYLAFSVLLGQVETLLQSAYRCVGRYSYGSAVDTALNLGAFAAMLIPVGLGYGPRTSALVYAGANVAGTLTLAALVKRDIPWVQYGWHHARFAEIRRLAPPAFAFMAFPLGQALNLQGTLMAVSYAIGPVAVVVFSTARTVSRIALQMVQMIHFSFEPEFAKSFAENDIGLLRQLHRRACQMALVLALGIVTAMILAGPSLLHHWTQGKVPPNRPLLSMLLAVVVLFSLWSTSSTVLRATNQHERLAAVYLMATALTVAATWWMTRRFGLFGAASSLLLAESLMILYVLPTTLRIVQDSWLPFLRSLLTVPAFLRPGLWMDRLSTRTPLHRP